MLKVKRKEGRLKNFNIRFSDGLLFTCRNKSILRPLQNSPKSPKVPPKTFRGFPISTFFQQTAQAMIAKHIDRFPLLKLDQVIGNRSNNT